MLYEPMSFDALIDAPWVPARVEDPFTNAVRIIVSALRKRLGEPWLIATVPGVGYRIDTEPDVEREGGDRE